MLRAREEEKAHQATTEELDEMIKDMKTALVDRKQKVADENLNSTQAWYELGMVQDELQRVKKKVTEDMTEMKQEIYDRISK